MSSLKKENEFGVSLRIINRSEYQKLYLWYKTYTENDLKVGCSIPFAVFCEWMDEPLTTPYFILNDGKTVGFAIVEYVPDIAAWYIAEIFVLREERDKGIGSRAFSMLLNNFRPEDVVWYTLDTNERAAKLWDKVAKDCQYAETDHGNRPIVLQHDHILLHYHRVTAKEP